MAPGNDPQRLTRRRRQVERLRQGLALALVVAAVAVAAVYVARRRAQRLEAGRHPELNAPRLGLSIQQSARGVTIAKSESGKPIFRVDAQRAEKLRGDGRDVLHNVKILVYADDGVHADQITGKQFAYDEASGALTAQGGVEIELQARPDTPGASDDGGPVTIEAHALSYNVKQGTGTIAQGIAFSYGQARGHAGAVAMDSHASLASFSGGVTVTWQRPGSPDLTVASQQAKLQRLPRTASDAAVLTLAGAASAAAGAESLRADQLVFYLRRDQTLRHLEASGHVVAADTAAGRAVTMQAGAGQADFAAAKQALLDRLTLSGGVNARESSAQGEGTLVAAAVEAQFTPQHQLEEIQARREARLTLPGTPARQLAADELDFHFAPAADGKSALPGGSVRLEAITTQGRANLEGPVRAAADHMRLDLDAGQQPALAVASGNVQVEQTVAGAARSSHSDRLEMHFLSVAGKQAQLQAAIETGHVELQQEARRIRAGEVVYTPADRTAVFTGAVEAGDPGSRFTAPTMIWTSRADGGDDLQASGGVALSFLAAATGMGKAAAPVPGPLLSAAQPVVVTAATLHWAEPPAAKLGRPAPAEGAGPATFRGTAVFTGAVRVMQAPNLLRADQLTLDASASTLVAKGHVQTSFITSPTGGAAKSGAVGLSARAARQPRAVEIGSEELQYAELQRQAVYRGQVLMQLADGSLMAPMLTVQLRAADPGKSTPAGLERAEATGGVHLTQPGRNATAQQASYDFAQGVIQLAGGPPSILDAEQGKITGDPLTFSLASDEIQVGSKPGTRARGQATGHN